MLNGKDLVQIYGALLFDVEKEDLCKKIGELLADAYNHSEELSH